MGLSLNPHASLLGLSCSSPIGPCYLSAPLSQHLEAPSAAASCPVAAACPLSSALLVPFKFSLVVPVADIISHALPSVIDSVPKNWHSSAMNCLSPSSPCLPGKYSLSPWTFCPVPLGLGKVTRIPAHCALSPPSQKLNK